MLCYMSGFIVCYFFLFINHDDLLSVVCVCMCGIGGCILIGMCVIILFSQSNVPLDLQEVDKSSAVVSYTPPDTDVSNFN